MHRPLPIRLAALGLALALAACTGAPPAAEPTAAPAAPTAVAAAPTAEPTVAPATPAPATATPPPTATPPRPDAAPSPTPPLPTALIGPETAGRLAVLRTVGLGGSYGSAFTPAGDALVVGTSAGLAWLRLPGLTSFHFAAVGPAIDVALAPDSTSLAHIVPSDDPAGRTALRRGADAALVAEVAGWAAAFSPDSATLATGSAAEARAWLWRADDGARVAELAGTDPRFSPDGAYVATVERSYDRPSTTRIFSADGAPLLELPGLAPAFSPDGGLVAVSAGDLVEIYALPGGEPRASADVGEEAVAAFSPDGRQLLIVAGPDLIVWDVAAGRELRRLAGVNRGEYVFDPGEPVFAPEAVATFVLPLGDCPPGGVRLSAVADGAVLHEDDDSYGATFAPDGSRAALRLGDGVRVVELPGGAVEERELLAYEAVAFSPDGALMATAAISFDDDTRSVGRVELWDVAAGERRAALETAPEDFAYAFGGLRFSPDGSRLSALVRHGCAAVGFAKLVTWELASGAIVGEIPVEGATLDAAGMPQEIASRDLAFAGDGSAAVWRDPAGGLAVLQAGREASLVPTGAEATAVDLSADGAGVAFGTADGDVTIFATLGSGGRPLGRLGGAVEAVRFSADGARVAAAGGGEAVVWELAGGDEVARFALAEPAEELELSADGQLLLARGPAGVAIYDLAGGAQVGLAAGAAGAADLGPGQRLLATVRDGRVLLWGAQ